MFDPGKLQIGDIVFIRISNFLYRRVAEATGSWISHVGLIDRQEEGEWLVAESTFPFSRYTPLTMFLRRSEKGKCAFMRLKTPPNSSTHSKLQAEARQRLRKMYHLGFDFDSRLQFCPKFVFEVYRDALGVDIGAVETFRDLLNKQPDSPKAFWKIWFLGQIPWDRRTVTPESQYRSELLEVVCENRTSSKKHDSVRKLST